MMELLEDIEHLLAAAVIVGLVLSLAAALAGVW